MPKDEAATQRLQDIWTENGLLREAPNLHHRVSEYGDAFALVWEPPADVDGEESGDVPVINYISPLRMRVVYDVDNPRRKKYAVHSWAAKNALGAEVWRANLYYADRVEKWRTEGGKPEEAASWVPALDDAEDPDSWTLDNPYGEVPVFHWRNGTPFGLPEHFDGYGAQDAVNKLVISDMATVDYHIFPQRYALIEDDESDDDFDVDDDPDFDGDDSTETPSPGRRGLDSGPGTMQWLKGVKSVGTFEPPASDAFTSRLKTYLGLMSQTTSTPMHMLDESGDEPSGESRRRKEAPLTKKVKDRQQAYAETWAEMLSFALKVDGRRDAAVDVRYAPAEVVSDAEGWTTVKANWRRAFPYGRRSPRPATPRSRSTSGSPRARRIRFGWPTSSPSPTSCRARRCRGDGHSHRRGGACPVAGGHLPRGCAGSASDTGQRSAGRASHRGGVAHARLSRRHRGAGH